MYPQQGLLLAYPTANSPSDNLKGTLVPKHIPHDTLLQVYSDPQNPLLKLWFSDWTGDRASPRDQCHFD
jgi:hypothetical protein